MRTRTISTAVSVLLSVFSAAYAQVPICPDAAEVYKAFSQDDVDAFLSPDKLYYPETWFHWVGGNVSET